MNMQNDFDEFDQVRRLLALKRHEQPPPGYFHRFSGQVIARIRAGERADDTGAFGRWFGDTSWLARLWGRLESQPILAAAVGAASCVFLLAGVVLSTENSDTAAVPLAVQPTMASSLGMGSRTSRGAEIEPVMLAAFEMTNSFGGASASSTLFAQPAIFTRSLGN